MNRILISFMACAISLTLFAQEQDIITYHSCDFTDGIPADYTTYDLDGQTLHYTMIQAGIKQGEAWARKKEVGKNNYYAMSACRYKKIEDEELKPSDDWMITPAIWVRGENAKLSWRSVSIKNVLNVGAGYEVLLSTTGNKPEDFTTTLFTIDEVPFGAWSEHEIDLSSYYGQHIYIAFHNNSAQGEILGVDDIKIEGTYGVCNLEATTGTHIFATNNLEVKAAITSYSETPITHMTLYYRHGDNTITETLDNLNIEKYQTYNHTFATTIPVNFSDTTHFTIGATVQDIPQDEIECSTVAFAFKTTRKTVVEEATGMWCQYCPSGIAAMDFMAEKYPDEFIGLALHYDDLIAVNDYVSDLGFPEGFPTAWVNRSFYVLSFMSTTENNGRLEYVLEGSEFEKAFLEAQKYVATTDIAITHIDTYNNQITIDALVRPAIDIVNTNYNIAFVIVEDNVWQDGYFQNNNFSGGEIYLPGWYERPQTITEDFTFNHVVRSIYDNYQGIEGCLPNTLAVGEEYSTSHTFDLPSTILNLDNVKVVAMIIDLENGEIVNACESASLSGVSTVTTQKSYCYASDNSIHINTPQPNAHIEIFDTVGRLVAAQRTDNSHTIIPIHTSGIYIVTITHDDTTTTHKVMVR